MEDLRPDTDQPPDDSDDVVSVVTVTPDKVEHNSDHINTDSADVFIESVTSSENNNEDQISKSLPENTQTSAISDVICIPSQSPDSDSQDCVMIDEFKVTDRSVKSPENITEECTEPPTKKLCSVDINQLHAVTLAGERSAMFSDSSDMSAEDRCPEKTPESKDIDIFIGPVIPPHLQSLHAKNDRDICPNLSRMQLQTTSALVTSARDFTSPDNYLRGCKWSPDGTCILTNSNDNVLRLFNLPEPIYDENGLLADKPPVDSVLKIAESDTVYDYCWYPQMSSANPETSCLASTCKDGPVHLWDAYTGELRCSYRPYNHLDEICAAYSLCFSPKGNKLYCGFNKAIRIFDVARPGRECVTRQTYKKVGQPGIISCITPCPVTDGLYAAGSYARGIALYSEPKGDMVCLFQGQQGGVTHIAFSPDGNKLYSGGRKDPEIICWDLRHPGHILFVALREIETNQRIYFDFDKTGKYLISGSHDGMVSVWDTTVAPLEVIQGSDPVLQPVFRFQAHTDTVNGVSLHPDMPLLATASGQRHFPDLGESDESDSESNRLENSLKFWWLF